MKDMSALKKLLLGILLISLVTFVALFGRLPALRRTPIGWLHKALCLHLPNSLKAVDRKATGGRVTTHSKWLFQYLFYRQNPVVLVGLLCPTSVSGPRLSTSLRSSFWEC